MRKSVKNFTEAMERKLKKNDWKGGWDTCDETRLLTLLSLEFVELKKAVLGLKSKAEIQEECVDVANFAMMIFDNSTKEG